MRYGRSHLHPLKRCTHVPFRLHLYRQNRLSTFLFHPFVLCARNHRTLSSAPTQPHFVPPNTGTRQTGGCPQAISSEEARERVADPSLPGGVITLKSQNGGGYIFCSACGRGHAPVCHAFEEPASSWAHLWRRRHRCYGCERLGGRPVHPGGDDQLALCFSSLPFLFRSDRQPLLKPLNPFFDGLLLQV